MRDRGRRGSVSTTRKLRLASVEVRKDADERGKECCLTVMRLASGGRFSFRDLRRPEPDDANLPRPASVDVKAGWEMHPYLCGLRLR